MQYISSFIVSALAGFFVEAVIAVIVYLWKHRKNKK